MSEARLLEATVLHTLAYRDTSLIATLLVRDRGVCRALARGARKRGTTPLQPGARLLVAWRGRGELKTLGRMELLRAPPRLVGERWYLLLYVNELLSRLAGHLTRDVELFDSYLAIMELLETAAEMEVYLRKFEFLLLRRLGYAIDFTRAADDNAGIEPEAGYLFQPELGFIRASAAQASGRTRLYAGAELLAIARGDFSSAASARAAKHISRAAFAPLLGGKPLKARDLFRSRQ